MGGLSFEAIELRARHLKIDPKDSDVLMLDGEGDSLLYRLCHSSGGQLPNPWYIQGSGKEEKIGYTKHGEAQTALEVLTEFRSKQKKNP